MKSDRDYRSEYFGSPIDAGVKGGYIVNFYTMQDTVEDYFVSFNEASCRREAIIIALAKYNNEGRYDIKSIGTTCGTW